ncbi:hypothetical protein PUNSTDRAFT_98327 [Punctularia strigosozonata HHB-11173 SS5]|uniref:uncharacterized protein n=1 Tax=Punctularia strigosozonata (strain HHB-11173) TaxID=741275 RepID=UPI0004417228|nr:uncharacterized protein PUNSTDRAFT_98327 [Punctularia strigosozonata HHB-11173 SS5]EIN11267.1 hypothetical protein PUNSTDRAFT_98327 [Punctularia strigosozonata HHB-11173 SS5]
MAHTMSVTFLGTSSGGGPTVSRNCSSLVVDALGDGTLWMVDCAEGTLRQFQFQPTRTPRRLKVMGVRKVFITHMHADHIMGLITLLRNNLRPAWLAKKEDTVKDDASNVASENGPIKPGNSSSYSPAESASVEIYGPAGLRSFVRQILTVTHTRSADKYVVHELLTPSDPSTPCHPRPLDDDDDDAAHSHAVASPDVLHSSELPGRDVLCSEDGFWRNIARGRGTFRGGEVRVDAGPIVHRDPCIGYVFREMAPPWRKLVILGDTRDADALVPLIKEPAAAPGDEDGRHPDPEQMEQDRADEQVSSALADSQAVSLLVHEATDAYIPPSIDPMVKKRSPELVAEKCVERGHSTPVMAGEFAKKIGARRVVLNHIGSRFPLPTNNMGYRLQTLRASVVDEIARQCTEAWGSGTEAVCAYDFLTVEIPARVTGYRETVGRFDNEIDVKDFVPRSSRRDDYAASDMGPPMLPGGIEPVIRSNRGGNRDRDFDRGGDRTRDYNGGGGHRNPDYDRGEDRNRDYDRGGGDKDGGYDRGGGFGGRRRDDYANNGDGRGGGNSGLSGRRDQGSGRRDMHTRSPADRDAGRGRGRNPAHVPVPDHGTPLDEPMPFRSGGYERERGSGRGGPAPRPGRGRGGRADSHGAQSGEKRRRT